MQDQQSIDLVVNFFQYVLDDLPFFFTTSWFTIQFWQNLTLPTDWFG